MITIFCLSNGDLGMELRDQPLSLDDRCYAFGIDPPNYPVPVIRRDVEFMPNRTILWTRWRDCWTWRYLAHKGVS